MKTKQFKHRYLWVLILSFLMIPFNSCDKDDDNDDLATFLETYVGTTWMLDDTGEVPDEEGIPIYFRFVNDASKILEGWYQIPDEPDCYFYYDSINIQGGVLSIVENSESKIVIQVTYGDSETETFTCTILGDVLTIVYLYEEDGFDPETYTIYFNKTTDDVDSLPLCVI